MSAAARDGADVRPKPRVPPPKPRPKPQPKPRLIKWLSLPPAPGAWGELQITVGKEVARYKAREVDCDFGGRQRGFELHKQGDAEAPVYHVLLDFTRGHHSCECLGFLRWAHCKHSDGLVALDKAGQLPPLRRQKHTTCPKCGDASEGGVLCPGCFAGEEFAARDQAAEMEAAGLDPWAECGFADDVYTTVDPDF